jgi:hypothetical protein
MEDLRRVNRLFAADVAAARLPANPGVIHRREHQHGFRVVRFGRLPFHRHDLRSGHIDVEFEQGQRDAVDQSVLCGQGETAFALPDRDLQLIVQLDLEFSVLLRVELVSAFRVHAGLHQAQRVGGINHTGEHGGFVKEWKQLSLHRAPPHAGRRQGELLLDPDLLQDRLGQGGFIGQDPDRGGFPGRPRRSADWCSLS